MRIALLSVVALGAAGTWYLWPFVKLVLGIPTTVVESQAIDDQNSAIGTHGMYSKTIAFSPDGKWLAYIWRDATYVYPAELGARPLTMTDALTARWRKVGQPRNWSSVPLDSVDLRPNGLVYYTLNAKVHFSPDSRHLGAICARYVVLIDLASGSSQRLSYPGEFFESMCWRSSDEILFCTSAEDEMALWRLDVRSIPGTRQKIHAISQKRGALRKGLPPEMGGPEWSPDGRYAILRHTLPDQSESQVLFDIDAKAMSGEPFALGWNYWKPDGSKLLVHDIYSEAHRILLVNAADGAAVDLTPAFREAFGSTRKIYIASPGWTVEGQYLVLYKTDETPPKSGSDHWRFRDTGYVVQPHPFKIILERDRILRPSPIWGWVLVQGDNTFTWTDYAGGKMAPIDGWPNSWTWSADGTQAVEIRGGEPVVFRPSLPR